MTLSKSTRYALYAAMEMARLADGETVSAREVAERYSIPEAVLAKVLQQLVRAGLAAGTRGAGGGYSLTRPASHLSVLGVIDVFDPPRTPGDCVLRDLDADTTCQHEPRCNLRSLLDEVDELIRSTFASVSLATLAGQRPRALSKLPVL